MRQILSSIFYLKFFLYNNPISAMCSPLLTINLYSENMHYGHEPMKTKA